MKRTPIILLLCLLFSTALTAGRGPQQPCPFPDSLRSVWLYTEGIKRCVIFGDSLQARELFTEALRNDPTYAPASYALAANGMYDTPEEAVELARRAWRADTANRWYHRFYGQALIHAERYGEALEVFRDLCAADPKDPDNYRLTAALYEQQKNPYMALSVLDSAEIRFGRIPYLSAMKRRLLLATHQTGKALEEARALVEQAPYEAEHHTVLADLYALSGKDSLARTEYDAALAIDPEDIGTLMSLSDFHNKRRDYRALLEVTRRLFLSDELPVETKVRRFEQLTSDTEFYRSYYLQLNDLASTLAIRYPHDKRVVELYARHLIASGELEEALALYKLHTYDTPPEEEYFRSVIDIEGYLQRPDSVNLYVDRALRLFPGRVDFHIAKGNMQAYTQHYDEALNTYREALRHAGSDSLRSAIWGFAGDLWHQKSEAVQEERQRARFMKECFAAYEKSLRYNKDNSLVLNNYAYFLSLSGQQLERALEMSGRAVALTDGNSTYLDTYAWVLFKLGRAEEAKKVMLQAIALDSRGNPELLVHYGDILHSLGERFLAETYWRKALEKGYDADEIARRMEAAKTPKKE